MAPDSFTHDFVIYYAGISSFIFFFWVIMYFQSGNRNYIFLLLATVSHILFNLNISGVILHYKRAEPAFLAFLVFAFCLLASEFMQFKKQLSAFGYSLFVIITLGMIGFQLLSPFFFDWDTAYAVSYLLFIGSLFYAPLLGLYLWVVKKSYSARFIFIAFVPALIGSLLVSLAQLGLLPTSVHVVTPISMIIWEFLIYYGRITYVAFLKTQREQEHVEKEELIQQQNIILERKVEQRTHELEIERERSEQLLIKASQKQMIELQLQSLRAQLNPHFMFNSLNAIQELILKEDFENSHTYLAKFARLLRMLLENTERPFTPLQKELDFLQLYLSLEKLRLPDLQFAITTDPLINKEETLIPNMILQPYIENALRHGLSYKKGKKILELNIQKLEGVVIYHVVDNGVGRQKSAELKMLYNKKHKSKGMELLNKRFKLLSDEFGSDIKTEIHDLVDKGDINGTEVCIMVPDTISKTVENKLYDARSIRTDESSVGYVVT
jgi:sensor histidine kinase YesM